MLPEEIIMQKWEYKSMQWDNDEQLNELGAEGWELVSSVVSPAYIYYVLFKRPVPASSESPNSDTE